METTLTDLLQIAMREGIEITISGGRMEQHGKSVALQLKDPYSISVKMWNIMELTQVVNVHHEELVESDFMGMIAEIHQNRFKAVLPEANTPKSDV